MARELAVLGLGAAGGMAGLLLGCGGVFPAARLLVRLGLAEEGPNMIGPLYTLGLLCPVAGALAGAFVAGLTASCLAAVTEKRADSETPNQLGDMPEP